VTEDPAPKTSRAIEMAAAEALGLGSLAPLEPVGGILM